MKGGGAVPMCDGRGSLEVSVASSREAVKNAMKRAVTKHNLITLVPIFGVYYGMVRTELVSIWGALFCNMMFMQTIRVLQNFRLLQNFRRKSDILKLSEIPEFRTFPKYQTCYVGISTKMYG